MSTIVIWPVGFVLGLIVDAVRSVVAPATPDWLRHFIPSEQRKANLDDNRARLEIMKRLKDLGLDPGLVRQAEKDVEHFISVVTSQQNAFVETQVGKIVEHHQTQLEMNEDAASRAKVASANLERILRQIELARFITDEQKTVLPAAHTAWEEYAKFQAEFTAEAYHGGSMMPLIYHSAMETLIITRTAELQRIYNEQSQQ